MADLTITPADVRPVEIIEQATCPAAEAINAGDFVTLDANAKFERGLDHATTPKLNAPGVALMTVPAAGYPVTKIRKGSVYLGDALNSLAYGAKVYASVNAGKLADAAGPTSFVVGTVEPAWLNTTPVKVLRVNL